MVKNEWSENFFSQPAKRLRGYTQERSDISQWYPLQYMWIGFNKVPVFLGGFGVLQKIPLEHESHHYPVIDDGC